MAKIFEGNWPQSVRRDAKYSVKNEDGKYVIAIVYQYDESEKWYPTTDEHDELVEMVNRIKIELNGSPGGPFYINEYRQVIVPAGNPTIYYYAGEYNKDLEFDFEGYKLSGKPLSLEGKPLSPNDPWEGPHQGIPYKLSAGAKDISYEQVISPRKKRTISLVKIVGEEDAKKTISKISAIIGYQGGRFYINEYRQLFTGMPYRYIGQLEDGDAWFPKPEQQGESH
jgi:hypothetical protein